MLQTEAVKLEVNNGLITRLSVAIVSQPPVVVGIVSVYIPAALYELPYQMNGN